MSNLHWSTSVAASAILIAFSSTAFAQSSDGGFDEIIVTSTKRAESLQDVSLSVSVLTAENLTDFGITGVQALQATTPGLVFSNTGALSQPFLRGVGTRLALSGLEPSVAVYVDDRYNSRTTSAMFDFADVERVEVLKGPQGTLFGRNVTGGAIRIITKDVSDEFEGNVTATAGNFDHWGLSGTISGPVSEDIGFRLAGLIRQRDGFATNLDPTGAPELDDQDIFALRGKLKANLSDTTTARLTLAYSERNDFSGRDQIDLSPPGTLNTGIAQGGISGTGPGTVATAIGRDFDDKSDSFTGQFRLESSFAKFDFASVSTYSKFNQDWSIDADGTSAAVVDVPVQFEDAEEISQEFQLTSNNDGNFNWIAGVNYYDSVVNYDGIIDVGLPFTISQGLAHVETQAYSAFGEATYDFNEDWSLIVGGRLSYEEKSNETSESPNADVTVVAFPFFIEDDWTDFSPKVTLEYHADNFLAYATFSQGFKSGGFNHPAPGTEPLDPENINNYELGLKGDFFNNRVRLNGSLYYYDYSDLQVTRAADGPTVATITENAANAEVYGIDLDATVLISDDLTLSVGANLLDSQYTEFPATARVFNSVLTGDPTAAGTSNVRFDAAGSDLLRAPNFTGFASLKYEPVVGAGTLPIVLTYSYKSDFDFDFVADPLSEGLTQEAYGLLNARIGYIPDDADWSISLWARNLTDEEYFDDLVANAAGLRGSFAPPRTYGVEVGYDF